MSGYVKYMFKGFLLWLGASIAYITAVALAADWASTKSLPIRLLVWFATVVSSALIILYVRNYQTRSRDIDKLVEEATELQRRLNERHEMLYKIEEAKKIQEQSKLQDLGEVLRSLGMTGELEQMEARASEMGLPFVDLERIKPDVEAIALVPLELIKEHRLLPIKLAGNQIWVAMENVNDIKAQDAIRDLTGLKVNPCMCLPEALDKAIIKLEET